MTATEDCLDIAAGVEISEEEGTREVFGLAESTTRSVEAAKLIVRFAAEVCAQKSYINRDGNESALWL